MVSRIRRRRRGVISSTESARVKGATSRPRYPSPRTVRQVRARSCFPKISLQIACFSRKAPPPSPVRPNRRKLVLQYIKVKRQITVDGQQHKVEIVHRSPLPTRQVLSSVTAGNRELEFDRVAGRRLGPITDLPNEPYEVIQSIPVAYTFFAADDVMASFDEADICCVEDSYEAALDGLKAAILTTFEVYSENEGRLDKRPLRCLEVLRQYVRPTE